MIWLSLGALVLVLAVVGYIRWRNRWKHGGPDSPYDMEE